MSDGRASVARRVILGLIVTLSAWALYVAFTGGVDLHPRGLPIKSTEPDRPIAAAVLLGLAYALLFRAHVRAELGWLGSRADAAIRVLAGRERYLALALAALTFFLGMRYGIHVAGGSDSWGYISHAKLWLAGDLITEQPIATQVPWPQADWTFAPLGYTPAQTPGAIVPVYAAGLSMLMALATLIVGACGPYVVVPILGAATVWLTYALGAALWSPLVGLFAAALMATSPTFLFMLLNPMSDVAVSGLFLAAFAIALAPWRSHAFWTGVATSAAILVRPNLVPIGAVFLAIVVARAERRDRWRSLIGFCAGGLPLMLAVAAIHTHLYGAPWKAGYGSLEQYYAWSYAPLNLSQFADWLIDTETPLIAVLLVPVVFVRRLSPPLRFAVLAAAAFIASVWLSYLFYTPFGVWWYLRFLLPAFPLMLLLAVIGLAWLLRRFVDARTIAAVALIVAMPVFTLRVHTVRARGVFGLSLGGVVYLSAAEYVRDRLPPNALIMTVQHSGSIRYYANRLTLRWDLLPAEWWTPALEVLVARGYQPYLLVSSFEEEQLRKQFGFSDEVDGPGSVVAEMTTPEAIRIYDPLRRSARHRDAIPAVPSCPCGAEP